MKILSILPVVFLFLPLAASAQEASSEAGQTTPPVTPQSQEPETKPEPPNTEPAKPEPAKPEPAKPEPAKPAAPREYVVQSGDNPWLIAKNHGVSLQKLLQVNEIEDPKNLKVGDVLKLPADAESKDERLVAKPVMKEQTEAESPSESDDWEFYTIREGDNPWKIAKAMKVDHQKIVKLNEGIDFTKLRIGQQIKVPRRP